MKDYDIVFCSIGALIILLIVVVAIVEIRSAIRMKEFDREAR